MKLVNLNSVINEQYKKNDRDLIQYGTAGFRAKAEFLGHIMYRMGLLAVLRSKAKKAAIGLMITASHNEEPDNGVKLVDPAGEMLETSWEIIASTLANSEDLLLIDTMQNIIEQEKINMSESATVVLGRDTRSSSSILLNAALAGVAALGGMAKNFEIVTTPQLHYLVVALNSNGKYGKPSLNGYYDKLTEAFKQVRGEQVKNGHYTEELLLDAANGVGAIAMKEFQSRLDGHLKVIVHNNGSGELNYRCGADYVKIQQGVPINFPIECNARCVSIDGDADRIVYFYIDKQKKFHLLDGDRIATLIAEYFKNLVDESGLSLQLGLVQTAYANGASTNYIKNILNIPVVCVSTGIKYLHSKALEFDIGVYFEANGHGTVVLKSSATEIIQNTATNNSLRSNQRVAAAKLRDVVDMINQTVGDALCDLLLVESILHAKGWDVIHWEKTYTDLPNMQLKVKVKDRNVITNTNAECQCATPIGLQEEIDKIVTQYPNARSFARPSGTEDVVRVYAECQNPTDLKKLIVEVASAVYRLADGIGPHPSLQCE